MKMLIAFMSIFGFSALGYSSASDEERAIEISSKVLTDAGTDVSTAKHISAFCTRDSAMCATYFTFSIEEVTCPDGTIAQVGVGKEVKLFDFENAQIEDFRSEADCNRRP
jgi:hypothetical protein